MRVSCPACGADFTLDALLVHEEVRRALSAAARVEPALARPLFKYLGLFRPPQRQLTMDRVAALLGELVPMIEAGEIERRGRRWKADAAAWAAALETMIAHRDAGALKLPLKSHGYLLEVLAGAADAAEARAERDHHARLARGERPARPQGAAVDGARPLADVMPPLAPPAAMPAGVREQLEAMGMLRRAAPAAGEAAAGAPPSEA